MVRVLSKLIAGSTGVIALVASVQAPAQGLRDVGWDDPFFASYVSRALPAPRSPGTSAAPVAPGDEVSFSLPVFGLPGVGEVAPVTESIAPLPLRSVVSSWPSCAVTRPKITTVPETSAQAAGLEPGTWYVRTFDFGCVEIVVEGDRNLPDPVVAEDQAREIRESGSIVIDYFDENAASEIDARGETIAGNGTAAAASTDEGTPVIGYTRGNLTYSFTIVCSEDESREFCNDAHGLRQLVEQFTVVAGRPQ